MKIDTAKWLRITLLVLAVDYIAIGLFSLMPDASGILIEIGYAQFSVILGLFALVIAKNAKKYHTFLQLFVLNEIGVVLVHVYYIVNEIGSFYTNVTILVVHLLYLAALVLLTEESILPSFGKSKDQSALN